MKARLASALLLLTPAATRAQEQSPDTARVAPVIVTATRVPLAQSALPVAVTVISGETLRARGVTRVADALQDVTSAYVAQAGSEGAVTSLFLRGGESKYVKVLVDGVPVNDPGGAYDFASLTTDNVDRIEVVRGPASVIYGADAVTGVVNVITRNGAGPAETDVDLRVGSAPRDRMAGAASPASVQTSRVSATTRGTLAGTAHGRSAYSFGIARHASSGLYQFNNAFLDNVVSARMSFAPSRGTALRVFLRYTDYRYNYPTNGGGTPVDSNAYRTEDRTVAGAEIEHALTRMARVVLALNSSVNGGGTDDQPDAPGGNSFVSQDKTRRRGADVRVQLVPWSAAALTFGVQMEQQDQRTQMQGAFGTFAFASLFNAFRRNTGVYTELVATPRPELTLTFGGRLDYNGQFGRFNTGRAGLSWRPVAGTRLRATAGNAFREPSFLENYSTGYVTGNPRLLPERARSADAGIDQDIAGGAAQVSVTAFAQRFKNLIDYTGDTSSCGYSYCNVAAATSNGIEAEIGTRLPAGWWATLGATFLRTRVLSPGFDTSSAGLYRSGESLIRRPGRNVAAELSYRGAPGGESPLTANARVTLVGSRTDRDFRAYPATPVTLRPYHRIDVGAEYLLAARGRMDSRLTVRVENLENTGYQTVFNFLAPRRTISVGVRMRM